VGYYPEEIILRRRNPLNAKCFRYVVYVVGFLSHSISKNLKFLEIFSLLFWQMFFSQLSLGGSRGDSHKPVSLWASFLHWVGTALSHFPQLFPLS
jgi:hypothetical protein